MNIDDIEYTDVQDFLDKYSVMSNGTLRSHASIKNTYTMLKSIFFYAAKKKRPYIDNAPTYGVKIPNGATSSKDDRVFTREELVNIFRACMTHNKYMTIAALALATGMRGEEFLALKWSDIDFDAKSISVSQASVRQHRKDEDGGKKWERGIGQVKTKSSVRVLYFGETLKQQLLAWKNEVEASAEYKKALRTGNADYLFLDAHGQLANVDYLRNNFRNHFARREFIDRPITFHMFRHSYATWAKSNGVEPFVIKSWMGQREHYQQLGL